MTDRYADIRAALAAATTGPWRKGKCFGAVVADKPTGGPSGSDHVEAYGGYLVGESMSPANISYIAACYPEAIRALLAERDALREALQSIVDCCDEDHAARDYSSRQTEIRGIARYALAKEQGEKHDNQD